MMQLKRPVVRSLLVITLILAVFTFNVQAAGLNPISMILQVTETAFSIFMPIVNKSVVTTVAPTPTSVGPTPSVTVSPPGGGIVINHNSIALYDQIPAQYLNAAENLKFMFMDRSVGSNIYDGLVCLSAPTWIDSASICRRSYIDASLTDWKTYTLTDNPIPAEILFPGGNSAANIEFLYGERTWEEDLSFFIQNYPTYANRDIFTFEHNYLHVATGSTIDNVYFDPNYSGTNIYDLVALESRYPNNTFVYWTTSLARTIGTQDAQSFNNQMRNWTAQNGKILLDIADIESHTPSGAACVNAQGYEILCANYTTETDGGHLGSVSAGKIQIAKAIWVMLAQIAGWQP
jgi:hypothetical protein